MKKLSIFFLATVFLASCDLINSIGGESAIQDIINATKTSISTDELPATAQELLDETYFETFVEEVNLADGLGYEVLLSDDQRLYFDLEGEQLENERKRGKKGNRGNCEPIDTTELAQSILDYIATNYADASIRRAKVNDEGEFIVGLSSHIFLLFDSEGTFIEEHEFAHRKGNRRGEEVAIEDLPTLVTDYISTNYVDAEILKAFTKNDKYKVGIVTTDDERKLLIFDTEGTFIEEKTCNGN